MENPTKEEMIDYLVSFNAESVLEDPDYYLRYGFVGYNNMSDEEINDEYKNIQDTNIQLEKRVQERTAELRENEDALKQTHLNYETFFNTIDEFLFVLDEQGNIIHTNSTVIDRLGYTEEELLGTSVLMVHPPERREEAGKIVGEMLNGSADVCPLCLGGGTGNSRRGNHNPARGAAYSCRHYQLAWPDSSRHQPPAPPGPARA